MLAAWLQVHGPHGMLGGSQLLLASTGDDFERGSTGTFFFELPAEQDCGAPLTRVQVGTRAVSGDGDARETTPESHDWASCLSQPSLLLLRAFLVTVVQPSDGMEHMVYCCAWGLLSELFGIGTVACERSMQP